MSLARALGMSCLVVALPAVAHARPLPTDSTLELESMSAASTNPTASSSTTASDGTSGMYVVWSDMRDGLEDVYLLRLTSAGTAHPGWPASGVAVCVESGSQFSPSVISDGRGGAIVTWLDNRDSAWDIRQYAQRVGPGAQVLWPAGGVPITHEDDVLVAIASDGRGGLLVAQRVGTPGDIYAVRLDSLGATAVGWDPAGVAVCTNSEDQLVPRVTDDGTGGAIIVWGDTRTGVYEIYGQRLDPTGVAQWAPDGIPLSGASAGVSPAIVRDGVGGALLAWSLGTRIIGQRVDASGALLWPELHELGSDTYQVGFAQAISDGLDGMIVTWASFSSPSQHALAAQRVDLAGTVQWAAAGVAFKPYAGGSVLLPNVVADSLGGAYAMWPTSSGSSNSVIRLQRITEVGAIPWGLAGIIADTAALSGPVRLARSEEAGVLLGWVETDPLTFRYVRAQRYDSIGASQLGSGASTYDDPGSQMGGRTVADGSGGAWVLWTEGRAGSFNLASRHVLPSGAISGPTRFLNQGGISQSLLSTRSDGAGGVIAIWSQRVGTTTDLYAQRIDASGSFQWGVNGLALRSGLSGLGDIATAGDATNGLIVVWTDRRNAATSQGDIYVQHVDAAGTIQWGANGMPLCTNESDQGTVALVPTSEGGVIAAWEDFRDPNQTRIYAQRVSGDGSLLWTPDGRDLASAEFLFKGAVPDGADGLLVLTWRNVTDPGGLPTDTTAFRVHRFDSSGSPLWGDGLQAVYLAHGTRVERFASDGAGGAWLVWEDDRAGAPDLYLQHVRSDATLDFAKTGHGVCLAPGWQYLGGLLPSPNGDVIVHWVDERSGYGDLFAQRLGPNGSPRWVSGGVPVCVAPRGQYRMTAATDDEGGAVFSWTDFRSGVERLVYSQRVDSSGFVRWSGNDVVPVMFSLVSVRASHDRVSLVWQIHGAGRATVERGGNVGGWTALAEIEADGQGRIAYEDRAIAPGARYSYRIRILADGSDSYGGEASVEIPLSPALALHGVSPNPTYGTSWQVVFSVATAGGARLQVVDVAGRIVAARELTGLEPGEQVITLNGAPSTPGIYFLRLTQGTHTLHSRVVTLRP